jgi:hypothetical protein
MSRKITGVVGGVALSLGLGGGCGGTPPTQTPAQTQAPTGGDPQPVTSVEQDLERLRALQVVEVGQLVLDLPAAATACYGIPCPGSSLWPTYDAEKARQAGRLDQLVTLANVAAHNQYLTPHQASEADAAVQALAGLQIVEVSGLVEAKPANNPSCYNLPCPADQAAAEAENARRVTVAFGIADAAKKSGL